MDAKLIEELRQKYSKNMPAFVRALFIKSSTNVELSSYIKRKSR